MQDITCPRRIADPRATLARREKASKNGFYFKTFCLPVACFWITVKMFQFLNWSNNNLGYILKFLKAQRVWPSRPWYMATIRPHGQLCFGVSSIVTRSASPILTPAKQLAMLFFDRRKSAGVPAAAMTVFSTDRRDRHTKSLITGMSVCISGLRCRDSEFHFGRLLRAGTHYLRHFLQSPSLTS